MSMKKQIVSVLLLFFIASAGLIAAEKKEYVLGPGDVIRITVYDHQDLGTEVRVSQDNSINFPLVGAIAVGGETPSGAETKIAGLLTKGGFVKEAQVNVLVTAFRSQQISVLGQVNRPGKYPIEAASTVTDLLAVAGGVNAVGADVAYLVRNGEKGVVKQEIDLINVFLSGGDVANVNVEADDTIYVPRAPQFYIYGEVQRPGAFRLERNMSAMEAISVGGGFTARGHERGVRIKRRDKDGTVELIATPGLGEVLRADDVIYVADSVPQFYIYGEVQRPGVFRLERSMSVMQAISVGGGFTQRGHERGVSIKRRGEGGAIEVISSPNPGDVLQSDDVIFVKETLF